MAWVACRSFIKKDCSLILSPIQLLKANHFWFYFDWQSSGLRNLKIEARWDRRQGETAGGSNNSVRINILGCKGRNMIFYVHLIPPCHIQLSCNIHIDSLKCFGHVIRQQWYGLLEGTRDPSTACSSRHRSDFPRTYISLSALWWVLLHPAPQVGRGEVPGRLEGSADGLRMGCKAAMVN